MTSSPPSRLAGSTIALVLVLGFATLGCEGAPSPPSGPALPDVPEWYEPVEPFRIVGPIHYVGTRELGVYLFATPEGHILLDGAMPRSAATIEEAIGKLGFEVEKIRHLLISQAHADHVGTLAHFQRRTGATVAVMRGDDRLLQTGGAADPVFGNAPAFHFAPVTVDRVLQDGDTVSLGGLRLTARHTPGHTPGCTTWLTTVEDGGRTYEVVFPGSTSVNPGTRLGQDPSYAGIAADYRRAFRVLESLKPEIFLAAHASFFDLDAKRARAGAEGPAAFVDPDGYRTRIERQKAKFEETVRGQVAGSGP